MSDSVYEDPTTWRLKTADAYQVPYRIVDMSGTFEPESASAQVEMLIPANRLHDFATAMFPPVVFSAFGFPVYPRRGRILNTPLQAMRINWRAHIDGKPIDPFSIDPDAPEDTYQSVCSATVDFATLNGNEDQSDPNDPETFLTVTCNGAGEYIHSVEPSAEADPALDADEEAKADGEDPAVTIMVPQFEWSANWPRVPIAYYRSVIRPRLRAGIGLVNSGVMPLFGNAPPETVLFAGFSSTVSYTWRSPADQFVQIGMKFVEKNVGEDPKKSGTYIGHNHFWQPGVGWRRILYNGTDPVYKSTNLNLLYST